MTGKCAFRQNSRVDAKDLAGHMVKVDDKRCKKWMFSIDKCGHFEKCRDSDRR